MKKYTALTLSAFVTVVSIASSAVFAQLTSPSIENISLFVGDIFEIYSVDGDENTNWILTQNNTFLETSTGMSFHTRFSQTGEFTLSTELGSVKRTFIISIENRQADTEPPNPQGSSIAQFDPPIVGDSIFLSPDRETIKISPIRKDISVIAIDSNTMEDSNGDGDPQNDDDTKDSLFRSGENSIYLWVSNSKDTTIRLGALYENNEKEFETIHVKPSTQMPTTSTGASANSSEGAVADMQITVLKNDNGEVRLALQMDNRNRESSLLLWNFGDGQQSMLDEPTHTFAKSGQYNVSVEIRDLQSGTILGQVSEDIIINRLLNDTPTPEDNTPEEQSSGGSIFGLIIKLLLTLIASSLIGAIIFFIIGKVKKKGFSLEKSLEKAEEVLIKTPKETVSEAAPPMEIHIEEPPIDVTPVEPIQTPTTEAEPVMPDWSQEPVPTPEVDVTPPPPEPIPEKQPPAEEPAPNVQHDAMQPSVEELKIDEDQAPDWLRDGVQKAEEVGQTPDSPPPTNLQTETPAKEDLSEKEQRLREKKRLKRQRYRQNLKDRKDGPSEEIVESAPEPIQQEVEDMDEPVAYIKAEDIEPLETETKEPPAHP